MIGASSIAFPLVLPRLTQSAAALPPSSSQKNPSLVRPPGKMALFRLNVLYTAGWGGGAAVDPLSPKTQKGGRKIPLPPFPQKGALYYFPSWGSIPKERGRVGTGWTDGGRGEIMIFPREQLLFPHTYCRRYIFFSLDLDLSLSHKSPTRRE